MQSPWPDLGEVCIPFVLKKKERKPLHPTIFSFYQLVHVLHKGAPADGNRRTYWWVLTLWHRGRFRKMNGGLSTECFPVYDLNVFLFIANFCFFPPSFQTSLVLFVQYQPLLISLMPIFKFFT